MGTFAHTKAKAAHKCAQCGKIHIFNTVNL